MKHPKYRADIDGLRAVAVGSVLAFHAFPDALPGGFIGVDIFFVISGFLITTIILQSHAAGDFSYRDFYARRVRRIFPALVLVLLATLAFGWYALLPREFSALGKQAAGGAAFVANFIFWGEAGYFDTAAETKPLLHLWSLGIEEQFYIFWPMLLALAWRRRWPMLRLLWALAVVSFLVNVLTIHPFRTAAFYSPASRFWELMVGGILACMRLQPAKTPPPVWRSHLQSCLGVGLIVLGLVTIRSDKAFPGWWALLPTLGAACCIAAGPAGVLNRWLLACRPMVWIGLISYPLYLWHWPLLVYARIVEEGEPAPSVRAAMVVASVALAWLTYRFVERFTRARTRPGMLRALAGGAIAVGVAGLLAFGGMPPRNGSELLRKVTDATADDDYYAGFRQQKLGGAVVKTVGAGARKVLLIGDSHVQQYAPRALELARSAPGRMATTYFATYGACPPVPGMVAEGNPGCEQARNEMLALALDPGIDAVVVGACWNCYFTGNFPLPFYFHEAGSSYLVNNGGEGLGRSVDALGKLLATLTASGKKVYLLLDNASGPDFEPRRLIEGSRMGRMVALASTPVAPLPPAQAQLDETLKTLARANGAEPVDVIAKLCADGQCLRATPDDAPVYKDREHLRPAYVRRHADYIDRLLLSP
ncbi:peptidoglycan/LPS O-acetylase OafA/YrhL [Variovorax sp. TBS-050B]|uniref:acyltransferase family protein n=1 Tax=Variovorax sp. TBS-050B TaxID=2940551 RepID=UPI0024753A47|nr:acyltransferase family protein [Variovorax sp. TBS-050B]MDH6591167.1 peptidoglycan/LPS O-acetylase OafA/YrhL [Variovorax sp. TBS-050B]